MPDTKKVNQLSSLIFNINSDEEFKQLALNVFQFQYSNNVIYHKWVNALKISASNVLSVEQIPFLPIQFFKNNKIISSAEHTNSVVFTSSATTSQTPSRHIVNDINLYEKSFLTAFELFYGKPEEYCILALLPNYLQRKGSSLVYMCNELIKITQHPDSGFFLNNIDELIAKIEKLKKIKQKTLLIGVSYALMDLADQKIKLNENFIVMETGGMKGTRKEMLKPELHAYLRQGFSNEKIHSEYGMTELLSQAYSKGDEKFQGPPWMKFLIREVADPFNLMKTGRTGGINVIDLANLYSCSFIATQDLGKLDENGKLELMGRYDNSDVRGCNLMMES